MSALDAFRGRPPFGPLKDHMEKVVECAQEVEGLVASLLADDRGRLLASRELIVRLEREADDQKNDLRRKLPRGRLSGIDRRDLLEILDLQDSIADIAEDIADRLVERTWTLPRELHAGLLQLTRTSIDTAVAARDVVRNVDMLASSRISSEDGAALLSHLDAVSRLEDESDSLEGALRSGLFVHEPDLSPVDLLLWLQVFEAIGDLADYPEKVCNRLRLLIST